MTKTLTTQIEETGTTPWEYNQQCQNVGLSTGQTTQFLQQINVKVKRKRQKQQKEGNK